MSSKMCYTREHYAQVPWARHLIGVFLGLSMEKQIAPAPGRPRCCPLCAACHWLKIEIDQEDVKRREKVMLAEYAESLKKPRARVSQKIYYLRCENHSDVEEEKKVPPPADDERVSSKVRPCTKPVPESEAQKKMPAKKTVSEGRSGRGQKSGDVTRIQGKSNTPAMKKEDQAPVPLPRKNKSTVAVFDPEKPLPELPQIRNGRENVKALDTKSPQPIAEKPALKNSRDARHCLPIKGTKPTRNKSSAPTRGRRGRIDSAVSVNVKPPSYDEAIVKQQGDRKTPHPEAAMGVAEQALPSEYLKTGRASVGNVDDSDSDTLDEGTTLLILQRVMSDLDPECFNEDLITLVNEQYIRMSRKQLTDLSNQFFGADEENVRLPTVDEFIEDIRDENDPDVLGMKLILYGMQCAAHEERESNPVGRERIIENLTNRLIKAIKSDGAPPPYSEDEPGPSCRP